MITAKNLREFAPASARSDRGKTLRGRGARRRMLSAAIAEPLERRRLLASSIVVIPGAAGSGSLDGFLSPTDGTITVADGDSVPGTISSGALAAVNATTNISIIAQASITFNDLGGTLALQTAAGHFAVTLR